MQRQQKAIYIKDASLSYIPAKRINSKGCKSLKRVLLAFICWFLIDSSL